MRRFHPLRRVRSALLMAAWASAAALPQGPPVGAFVFSAQSTGLVQNTTPVAATSPAVVISHAGAAWLRLKFADVILLNGASVRITGALDEAVQTLDAAAAAAWHHTSAAFNGDVVVVELLLPPYSCGRVDVEGFDSGFALVASADTLCLDPIDHRTASTDPRVGRVLFGGFVCTGFLISAAWLVTAGHCGTDATDYLVEFNVPASTAGGALVHPPPVDQYVSLQPTNLGLDAGPGDDWRAFQLYYNLVTGIPAGVQQGFFAMQAPPTPIAFCTVTGYGGAASGPMNFAQSTDTDGLTAVVGTRLEHEVDTTGGDSGAPIIDVLSGAVFGIHTHGGCGAPPGEKNKGTSLQHIGLQAHLAFWCAIPGPFTSVSQPGAGQPISVQVSNAPAGGELMNVFSPDLAIPTGSGAFFGLNASGPSSFVVVSQLALPLGFAPFHVVADAAGSYATVLPAGGGATFSLDVVTLCLAPNGFLSRSGVVNVTLTL